MIKHEIKTCPHCQKNFECKRGNIISCQCESVELQQHHLDEIAQRYDDCLCAHCLEQLRDEYNINQHKHI